MTEVFLKMLCHFHWQWWNCRGNRCVSHFYATWELHLKGENEKLGGCWEEWRLLLPSPALEMVQGLHLGDMSGTRCLGRALTESMKCSGSRASVLWKFVSRRGVWAALICLVGWHCDAGCAAGQWGGLGCFGRPNPTFPTQQESFPLVNRLQ